MNYENVQFGVVILNGLVQWDLTFSIAAEKIGYDSVWIYDHSFLGEPWNCEAPEAMTLLTAIAMKTKTLKLGTCVIDAGRRNPATLAQTAATLDVLSNGRVLLGMGAGGNYTVYGYTEPKRYTRLRECVEVLNGLWTAKAFSFHGEIFTYPTPLPRGLHLPPYYRTPEAKLKIKPIQKPKLPILIGAHGPKSLKMIGQIGDGWFPNKATPETYEEDWSKITAYAKTAGRNVGNLISAHMAFTSMAEEYNDAEENLAPIASRVMINASRPPLHFHRRMGYSNQWIEPKDVPSEVFRKAFIFGTQDQCISKMERFIKAGVKHFALTVLNTPRPWPSVEKAIHDIKVYYKKVVSYFKD